MAFSVQTDSWMIIGRFRSVIRACTGEYERQRKTERERERQRETERQRQRDRQ